MYDFLQYHVGEFMNEKPEPRGSRRWQGFARSEADGRTPSRGRLLAARLLVRASGSDGSLTAIRHPEARGA